MSSPRSRPTYKPPLKDDKIPAPTPSDYAELVGRRKLRADTLTKLRDIIRRIKQFSFPADYAAEKEEHQRESRVAAAQKLEEVMDSAAATAPRQRPCEW